MNRRNTAYLLWAACFLGLGGLHRLYNGKVVSGLLWLFTGGLFGIGQFVDLFLIPGMVEDHNLKYQLRRMQFLHGVPLPHPETEQVVAVMSSRQGNSAIAAPPTRDQLMLQLLHVAQTKGGKLSVTQGVMATGVGFTEVETILQDMAKTGYVGITNDPQTGVVLYDFREL